MGQSKDDCPIKNMPRDWHILIEPFINEKENIRLTVKEIKSAINTPIPKSTLYGYIYELAHRQYLKFENTVVLGKNGGPRVYYSITKKGRNAYWHELEKKYSEISLKLLKQNEHKS